MTKDPGGVPHFISFPAWVPGSVTIVFSVSHGCIDRLERRSPVHAHGRGPVCQAAFGSSLLPVAGYFID